jgi:hypothetical protein
VTFITRNFLDFEQAYIVHYDLILSIAKPCSCYYIANHFAFLFGVICDLQYVNEFEKVVENFNSIMNHDVRKWQCA